MTEDFKLVFDGKFEFTGFTDYFKTDLTASFRMEFQIINPYTLVNIKFTPATPITYNMDANESQRDNPYDPSSITMTAKWITG